MWAVCTHLLLAEIEDLYHYFHTLRVAASAAFTFLQPTALDLGDPQILRFLLKCLYHL